MKKLVNLFFWFCAATVLAQVCILGMASVRGNFNRKIFTQIVALLNGIDIQGERLKEALVKGRATPTPTYQDILEAKTNATLQIDSRARALDVFSRQLDERQRNLQAETERFDRRRDEFNAELDKHLQGAESDSLKEIMSILQNLAPEYAKAQLLMKLEKEEKTDVVAILRGMAPDKLKKILAEFTQPEDQEKLAEVLREIRRGEPIKSLVEKAKENP